MRHRILHFYGALVHRLFGMLFRTVFTSLIVVLCLVLALHLLRIPLPILDEVLRDVHHVVRTVL